ncbi:hypothetical protein [Roseiarcus sp.]|uniref:hypothetical protein n=1 Tax=Roseiarcus sp. TaxID=1969460 RepID=UPI003F9455FF
MLLVTANAQSELTPIERGRHALRSKMDVKACAASVGRAHATVNREVMAARVAGAADFDIEIDCFSQLVEIHAAPEWLWRALVAAAGARKLSRRGTALANNFSPSPRDRRPQGGRRGGLSRAGGPGARAWREAAQRPAWRNLPPRWGEVPDRFGGPITA